MLSLLAKDGWPNVADHVTPRRQSFAALLSIPSPHSSSMPYSRCFLGFRGGSIDVLFRNKHSIVTYSPNFDQL